MFGNNCHNKSCFYNNNRKCCLPKKKMFMLCEMPSKKEVDNIRQRVSYLATIIEK